MDVAAELFIHMERNAVTPIRPAMALVEEQRRPIRYSSRSEVTLPFHRCSDTTENKQRNSPVKVSRLERISQGQATKENGDYLFEVRRCYYFRFQDTRLRMNMRMIQRQGRASFTIGNSTNGSTDVTGRGITSKTQKIIRMSTMYPHRPCYKTKPGTLEGDGQRSSYWGLIDYWQG